MSSRTTRSRAPKADVVVNDENSAPIESLKLASASIATIKPILTDAIAKQAPATKKPVKDASKKPIGKKQSRSSMTEDDVKPAPSRTAKPVLGVATKVLSAENSLSAKPPIVPQEEGRATRGKAAAGRPKATTRGQKDGGEGKRGREESGSDGSIVEIKEDVVGRPRSGSNGSVSEMVEALKLDLGSGEAMEESVVDEQPAGRTRRGKKAEVEKVASTSGITRPARGKAKIEVSPVELAPEVEDTMETEAIPAPSASAFILPQAEVTVSSFGKKSPPVAKSGRGRGRGRGAIATQHRNDDSVIASSSPVRPQRTLPVAHSSPPSPTGAPSSTLTPSKSNAMVAAMSTLTVGKSVMEDENVTAGLRRIVRQPMTTSSASVAAVPSREKAPLPVARGVPGVYVVGSLDNVGFPVGKDVFELKCLVRVDGLPAKVGSIAAGSQHALVVSEDGKTVWSFGNNDDGALGRTCANTFEEQMPHPVQGLSGMTIKKVTCCDSLSVFLLDTGKVYTCGTFKNLDGENHYTQDVAHQPLPTLVDGFSEAVVDIASGANFVLAVTKSGQLYAWGEGKHGQLGHEQRTRTQVNTWKPYKLGVAVAKSETTKAKVAVFVSVFAGPDSAFAVDDQGTVHAFGSNNWGQLGVGDTQPVHPLPVIVKAIAVPDPLTEKGKRSANVAVPLTPLRPVKAVASGNFHTVFLMEDGRMLATGRNDEWQLGQGRDGPAAGTRLSTVPVVVPVDARMVEVGCGLDHCVAVDEEGGVWMWGWGEGYMLGNAKSRSEPEPLRCGWIAKSGEVMDGRACRMEGMKVRMAAAGANFTMVVAEME